MTKSYLSLAIAVIVSTSAEAEGIKVVTTEDGAAEAMRWVIGGSDGFTLAEEHGGIGEMTFDFPPVRYRVTVGNDDTGAAASQEAIVAADERQRP